VAARCKRRRKSANLREGLLSLVEREHNAAEALNVKHRTRVIAGVLLGTAMVFGVSVLGLALYVRASISHIGFFTPADVNLLMGMATAARAAVPQAITSVWQYPADDKAIVSKEPPTPYKAKGLPDGTVSILTKYREPGLRVRRPDGGFWRFESVAKLYYHGKLFALVGAPTGINSKGHDLGWITSVVIYDEDGDGKLETPVDVNGGVEPFSFHVPRWVTQ
jgi:hypothetical protein